MLQQSAGRALALPRRWGRCAGGGWLGRSASTRGVLGSLGGLHLSRRRRAGAGVARLAPLARTRRHQSKDSARKRTKRVRRSEGGYLAFDRRIEPSGRAKLRRRPTAPRVAPTQACLKPGRKSQGKPSKTVARAKRPRPGVAPGYGMPSQAPAGRMFRRRRFTRRARPRPSSARSMMKWKRAEASLPISSLMTRSVASASAISTRSSAAGLGVERRLPQHLGHHLAEALEAGDLGLGVALRVLLRGCAPCRRRRRPSASPCRCRCGRAAAARGRPVPASISSGMWRKKNVSSSVVMWWPSGRRRRAGSMR